MEKQALQDTARAPNLMIIITNTSGCPDYYHLVTTA